MDLVEVAPAAKPPVCKIMDYGKYLYEQRRREREARKLQKFVDIKEIRLTKIETYGFQVKIKRALNFGRWRQSKGLRKIPRTRDRPCRSGQKTSDAALRGR